MSVQVSVKGIIGILLFGLLFTFALETRALSDYIRRAVILTVVIGGSVGAIVRMIRRRHMTPYGQTLVLPRGLSRWLLGESDLQAKSH